MSEACAAHSKALELYPVRHLEAALRQVYSCDRSARLTSLYSPERPDSINTTMLAHETGERSAFSGKAIELGRGQSAIRIGLGQDFLSLWPDGKLW